ncbi:MAG: ethylbenzene dehydrogenase-related protein [Betaproteobacteria bacterium]
MLKSSLRLAIPVALSAVFALSGQAYGQATLTAVKVAAAPKLAALASDPAWAKAPELKFGASGGMNFNGGKTDVAMKAVYTSDMLYVLLQYADPTQSVRRSPFVKQADGSWKKLSDPDDKGGDNNKYYEDKFAFIWNINNSIEGFDKFGCMTACHAGEQGKPYGNKYTSKAGELGDIWHMKSVRGGYIGQIDNQYLDNTTFDKEKSPEAGRKSDPKTGGGYADIKLVNGKPEFMSKDGKAANKGGLYYLKEEDKVAFDDSKFVAGDEVSSILVSKFTGERGVIDTVLSYKDGKYTFVIARKLVTDGKFDVQFKDLGAKYPFGFAAFDNAQVRHAVNSGVINLVFAK